MTDYLSTSSNLPGERLSQHAPSRESQNSTFPFHASTRKSTGPTSMRPHLPKTNYTLNDDVLLHILYLYRLHIRDEEDGDGVFERRWDRQRWWYKLAQVSRQWRHLILASATRLDLQLLCTYGVPVAEMLTHSPLLLPLTIFYNDGYRELSAEDEEGVLLALRRSDCVRRIALTTPAQRLPRFLTAMDGKFPILERLYITGTSPTSEPGDTNLVLPETFQAPRLHHIDLLYAALPIGSPLLTTGLVELCLGGISSSAYFPPSYLLLRLSLMPQLETLGIGFHSPLPNRDVFMQLLETPIMIHVNLPNLRSFSFRGVSAYLEGLISRITAPDLNTLTLHFFNQLTFDIPHLLEFVKTSENLIFGSFQLAFDRGFVGLKTDPHRRRWKRRLELRILCKRLDWQVASALQILGALSPLLSDAEILTLSRVGHNRSERRNELDRTRWRLQWRELLRPFNGVKALRVENELVGEISRSLRSEDGDMDMPMQLLPKLQEVRYFGGSRDDDAFTPFIKERKSEGHAVFLVYSPIWWR
jgi:hypothetical protein